MTLTETEKLQAKEIAQEVVNHLKNDLPKIFVSKSDLYLYSVIILIGIISFFLARPEVFLNMFIR